MKVLLCVLVTLCALASLARGKSYDRYKVVRVVPKNSQQLRQLMRFKTENVHVDFWKEPRAIGHVVDVNLSPADFPRITQFLESHNIHYEVTIDNVQEVIDSVTSSPSKEMKSSAAIDYSVYNNLEDIDKWLDELATEYSDIATLVTVGTTYEGRTLRAVRIAAPGNTSKPAFWMDGGIHSREWISPASVIYILGNLLSGYGKVSRITNLIHSMDVYILPVFNADGYAYTWTKDRLWRKTREPNSGSSCIGTDPNRNWDWHWGESGASKNPCAEDFAGTHAFSQISVRDVANYLKEIPNLEIYINFHSYSQLWMYPWAYTKEDTKDYTDQRGAAVAAVDALKAVHGTVFEEGAIAKIIYVASGSTADWTYGAANVKYSYGVELRDKGRYGFLLPPTEIVPSGEETLSAILALAEYAVEHK